MKQAPGIPLIKIKREFIVKQQPDDIAMLDQYPLGFSRGARGVDDIGERGGW